MTARKPKRPPNRTQLLARCDLLFGRIVRHAGRCENCDSTEFLQCAHGFSRSYRTVRWDRRNAFCLCRGCHVYFTHRPLEWDGWLRERWGDSLYAELRGLALTHRPPDLSELAAELSLTWATLKD